jgi:catechol 2,3-dioxygenase
MTPDGALFSAEHECRHMVGGSLPADTDVGRVGLTVADLGAVRDFYTSVIGLDVLEETSAGALLGPTSGPPILVLEETDADPRPTDAAGLFHHAIRVPDREALGTALTRIENRWALDGASDHGVSEALYLQDPEGNGVEVYRDRPRSEWPRDAASGVEMYTRPLDIEALGRDGTGTETLSTATMGHVHLEVTDLGDSERFYGDTLGFGVADKWDQRGTLEALFLAAGDYHHHVGLNTWGGRTQSIRGRGLGWFEVVVPDAEAVRMARQRLEEAGLSTTDRETGFELTDPDEIRVRIRS